MTDAALFDMQPIEAPEREPGLSADRRRTIRQSQDIAAGYHPLLVSIYGRGPWARLHDNAPTGTAPGDRNEPYTCGTCYFRHVLAWHNRSYPKCTQGADNDRPPLHMSHGAATDVRAWWPACHMYSPSDAISPDAARWIPEDESDDLA